jgi:hypothetical protein
MFKDEFVNRALTQTAVSRIYNRAKCIRFSLFFWGFFPAVAAGSDPFRKHAGPPHVFLADPLRSD